MHESCYNVMMPGAKGFPSGIVRMVCGFGAKLQAKPFDPGLSHCKGRKLQGGAEQWRQLH